MATRFTLLPFAEDQLKYYDAKAGDVLKDYKTGDTYIHTGKNTESQYPDDTTCGIATCVRTGKQAFVQSHWKLKIPHKRPPINKLIGGIYQYDDGRERFTFTLIHEGTQTRQDGLVMNGFYVVYHTHNRDEKSLLKAGLVFEHWDRKSFYLCLHGGSLKEL